MSGFVRYMPAIPLGEFVDYLYVDLSTDSTLRLKEYVQSTHPLLIINAETPATFFQHSKIKGVFTQALQKKTELASHHSLGIRFKPYGMFTGFGLQGEFVANRIISSSIVLSKTELQNTLEMLRCGKHQTGVEYVHNILYNNLEPKPLLYEITDMIDTLVVTDISKNSQRNLAQAFERTPKSFIEVFRKAIGVTPLNYLHIHKIDEAKRLIREQPSIALTDVGYSLGFYDQSHFIKVFKSHTGKTPFQYKTALSLVNSVQF